MNHQQLKIFVLTAQYGKLTEVAEYLELKQPTVTFHLNKLQQNIGVQLFSKTRSQQWVLTDAGTAFYHYANQIIQLSHEAEMLMKEYQSLKRGKVFLGASYTPASYILPSHLANFQKKNKEVYVSLMVKKAPSILDRVKNYQLDIGVMAYGPLNDPELNIIPVMEDELVLIMHPNHPLAEKQSIQLHDLSFYSFILHEKKAVSRLLTEQWQQENKLKLKVMMEMGSIQTIKEAIASDIGLSIVPKLTVEREKREGKLLVRTLPNYQNQRYIYLIHRKNQLFTPLMEKFYTYLQHSLQQDKGTGSASH
ncbi:LysR family transcriptional regulator YeiE [Gracilibacillus boraciitolerans JCM 21714]|uniref:LysR family transcriptional regulator YeiE n=1 Tax=Gracilibacillus boraciitolerans JCM 21714 TaxID=1298598 RepID=W4VH19_9BACI|nr:LysR family transcriptional regulator [Gracilibacillus boraciitolerans]GAE92054.1 LysR family transcriptional regulator YeiE [Gracilibacillus boraciitolerans JCM 21714]